MAENGAQPLTAPALRNLANKIANDTRYSPRTRLITAAILDAEAARTERGEA